MQAMKFEKGTKYLAYSGNSLVGEFSAETAAVLASKPAYRRVTWKAVTPPPIPKHVKKADKAEDKAATKKAVTDDEGHTTEPIPADREDQRGAGGPAE
jgi:hypothetical protein